MYDSSFFLISNFLCIFPDVGLSIPNRIFNNVVLPAPFGPLIIVIIFFLISKVAFLIINLLATLYDKLFAEKIVLIIVYF